MIRALPKFAAAGWLTPLDGSPFNMTRDPDIASVAILTSDVYEFAPGGFFVVHSAYGKIGETSVGGVEIIGVDGDAYRSTFYDSFGNVHSSRMEIDGNTIRWLGERTRCTANTWMGAAREAELSELCPPPRLHCAEPRRGSARH